MKIGYARVSTTAQNLEMQIDALRRYGCDEIYTEKESGARIVRPQLEKALEALQPGDTLVVYDLKRLGRTIKQLILLVEQFTENNINIVSLHENIDTTTASGRFVLNLFCALAQMEREIIIERTNNGLEAARSRGRIGGRPPISESEIKKMIELYRTGMFNNTEIAKMCHISRTSLYSYLQREGIKTLPNNNNDKNKGQR